jgi:hypothetical protein
MLDVLNVFTYWTWLYCLKGVRVVRPKSFAHLTQTLTSLSLMGLELQTSCVGNGSYHCPTGSISRFCISIEIANSTTTTTPTPFTKVLVCSVCWPVVSRLVCSVCWPVVSRLVCSVCWPVVSRHVCSVCWPVVSRHVWVGVCVGQQLTWAVLVCLGLPF